MYGRRGEYRFLPFVIHLMNSSERTIHEYITIHKIIYARRYVTIQYNMQYTILNFLWMDPAYHTSTPRAHIP